MGGKLLPKKIVLEIVKNLVMACLAFSLNKIYICTFTENLIIISCVFLELYQNCKVLSALILSQILDTQIIDIQI